MAKQDPFEKKIREKLEQLPSPEDEGAWEKFSQMLDRPETSFWKHWLSPYLYATVLFLGAIWWLETKDEKYADTHFSPEEDRKWVDTVHRSDTVYLVDTVYMYQKIFVKEIPKGLPGENTASGLSENPTESIGIVAYGGARGLGVAGSEATAAKLQQGAAADSITLDTSHVIPKCYDGDRSAMVELSTGLDLNVPGAAEIFEKDLSRTGRRKSYAAPAVTGPNEFVMRAEKEIVVGDTSNLNQTFIPRKMGPSVHLEAGTSLQFPISRLIEYYTPIQYGAHLGLEWRSGWGLYLGAIGNQVEGELDDEEIMALDPALVDGLPGVPEDISNLDEIYLTNRQWFFPLELRWQSPRFAGVSFESAFGIVGNYLYQQDFTYEFENNFEEEYDYASARPGQFTVSHLRLGVGTNYLLTKRWKLLLRSQYWLPVSKTGLLRDRTHGVSVEVGANFSFGK
ncbi:hypothetical protein SAMN04488057_101202 [Cyclobacterium lianum]|uniref:Outer membrane protein beta-barrel domain-containing protein n=1 Tax=Cyclobacterium lianum TaxID=388280 RepID=A0A1M7I5X1_9BACT|nr:hypothetical protein [Cyclobacterium lianum]SHM36095.1 hypothetical protein SAMN04488057_101202 [Cyclobacterium lianum]